MSQLISWSKLENYYHHNISWGRERRQNSNIYSNIFMNTTFSRDQNAIATKYFIEVTSKNKLHKVS